MHKHRCHGPAKQLLAAHPMWNMAVHDRHAEDEQGLVIGVARHTVYKRDSGISLLIICDMPCAKKVITEIIQNHINVFL